jgi:hypothetical protein
MCVSYRVQASCLRVVSKHEASRTKKKTRCIMKIVRQEVYIRFYARTNYLRDQNHCNSRIDIPQPSARVTNSSTLPELKAKTIFATSAGP